MYRPVIKKEWIQTGILNSFSGMYLTMLSIIQGVALGLLVGQIYDTQTGCPNISTHGIEFLLMCFLTLLIIIVLWHSYFWLSVVAAWTPLIWDSLFMFLIGAIEFIAVKSIGSTDWFYAVAFIGVVGSLQYFYNRKMLPKPAWHDNTKDVGGEKGKYGIPKKDIGGWIRKYKWRRGWRLLGISLVVLLATWLSHKYSWFSCLIFGYSLLKALLFVGVSAGLGYAIYQHLDDQKETLMKLE